MIMPEAAIAQSIAIACPAHICCAGGNEKVERDALFAFCRPACDTDARSSRHDRADPAARADCCPALPGAGIHPAIHQSGCLGAAVVCHWSGGAQPGGSDQPLILRPARYPHARLCGGRRHDAEPDFQFLVQRSFTRIGWMPHGGLALANSTATLLRASWFYWC